MELRHALFLLILSGAVFADCVGYNDSFNVRVLDGSLRPVEGAHVTVTYDRGAMFGGQYFTTPSKPTGKDGTLRYEIFNQGTLARPIDCTITIDSTVEDAFKSVKVTANQHGPTVDVVMDDVFILRFYVRNQLGAGIENASVSIGSRLGKTDSKGTVMGYYRNGQYDYFANYLDASQGGKLNVSGDTEYEVIFKFYKIAIDVTDDKDQPLDATLHILNKTFQLESGHFENDRAFGEVIPYSLEYMGLAQEGAIVPSTQPITTVRFDINPPQIESISPTYEGGRYRLNITVSDPNQFASGTDVSSVKVRYKLEPSDATTPWSSALVFTSGLKSFTADFPELPPNSIVKFLVEVKDKAGNRAEREGKFSTFAGTYVPPNETENDQNNTQNQTNTQPGPEEEQGIPLIYIVIGVIVLLFGVYLVFRIKSRQGAGG